MLQGNPELATQYFEEARLLAPDDTLIVEDLIRAQIATGQFSEAEYNLARIQKTSGYQDRRDIMHMRARCLLALDRPMDARQLLIKLTQGDEGAKDVTAWIELGNVSYLLKDDRRLYEASSRAMAVAPERFEGYALRGLYHRRRGELERALESFDKAVERRGTETQPLVLQGLTLEDLGRPEQARECYEVALAQNPDDVSIAQLLNAIPPKDTFATAPDDNP
jgi:Flp pilus assembly protein TadD